MFNGVDIFGFVISFSGAFILGFLFCAILVYMIKEDKDDM